MRETSIKSETTYDYVCSRCPNMFRTKLPPEQMEFNTTEGTFSDEGCWRWVAWPYYGKLDQNPLTELLCPSCFNDYVKWWDGNYESNNTNIANLITEGLSVDGEHHKQWFLEQIAKLVDLETEEEGYEKGVAP